MHPEQRVCSEVPRTGVRRGQRVQSAGTRRVRIRHGRRAQSVERRLSRVRVREQHSGRVRGRRARVRHERIQAPHGLADRGKGMWLPGQMADRSGGLLHGLSATHRTPRLGGRADCVVRDAGRRGRGRLRPIDQGATVRRGALLAWRQSHHRNEPILLDQRRRDSRDRFNRRARLLGLVQETQTGPMDQRAVVVAPAEDPFHTQRRWRRRRRPRQAQAHYGHARGKDLQRDRVACNRGTYGFDRQPL